MNLAHLYYFRTLVEVRNYSQAAKELYIAQPTLSLAVSSLEKELGVSLIKKKRSTLELTEDGEDFYEAVVKATNALDNATKMIQERSSAVHGSIRIGTVYSIQNKSWSAAMRDYRTHANKKVQMQWKQGTTESLMHELKNGSLDVIMAGVLGKSDPDIVSIPCFAQGVTLVVNQKHPLAEYASRGGVSLSELGGIPIITYRNKKGPFKKEITDLLGPYSQLNVSYDYNDEITLASLVVAEPKIVAVACHSWLIDSFPEVVTVPIKEAPQDFHRFYISYLKRDRMPFAVEEFVQFMKDYDFQDAVDGEEDEDHLVAKVPTDSSEKDAPVD